MIFAGHISYSSLQQLEESLETAILIIKSDRLVNLPTDGGPKRILNIPGKIKEPRMDLDVDSTLVQPKGEVPYSRQSS